MTDRSLIQAAMWASKQPADRIAFKSAGAVRKLAMRCGMCEHGWTAPNFRVGDVCPNCKSDEIEPLSGTSASREGA
jgi:uncharacterized CHY-type Zn-finger protein